MDMTALEARQLADKFNESWWKSDYASTIEKIKIESSLGKYSLNLSSPIHKDTIKKLEEDGYVVTITNLEMGGYNLKISW